MNGSLKHTVLGSLKLISFIATALIAAVLIFNSLGQPLDLNFFAPAANSGDTIASVPLKFTNFPDVGQVASPHLDTTIIHPTDQRQIPITFLVDSGAKISALPMSYADKTGLNKDTAKRIYLRSATNTTTYGYLSEVNLKLNDTIVTIPIAYADIIEPLLGTHGFFDQFTVVFENGKTLIIKQKT